MPESDGQRYKLDGLPESVGVEELLDVFRSCPFCGTGLIVRAFEGNPLLLIECRQGPCSASWRTYPTKGKILLRDGGSAWGRSRHKNRKGRWFAPAFANEARRGSLSSVLAPILTAGYPGTPPEDESLLDSIKALAARFNRRAA